jgi:hypothetical protein
MKTLMQFIDLSNVKRNPGRLGKMSILTIFKKETRRSGKDRRKCNSPQYTGQERRRSSDRRSEKDRRRDVGRRSGIYHKLPDKRKDTVDSILEILEHENLKKK